MKTSLSRLVFLAVLVCHLQTSAFAEPLFKESFVPPADGQEAEVLTAGKFIGEDIDRSLENPPARQIVSESPFDFPKTQPAGGVLEVASGGLTIYLENPIQNSFWFTFQMVRMSPSGFCFFSLQSRTGHDIIIIGDFHADKVNGINLRQGSITVEEAPETTVSADTPSVVVGFYDYANEITTIWLDPEIGTTAPAADTAYLTATENNPDIKDFGKPPFGRIQLAARANTVAVFDEIRIAETWEDLWK